jgi:hypothetical protein
MTMGSKSMNVENELSSLKARLEALEVAAKMKTTPDEPWYNWNNAPEGATHAAVDKYGYGNWYGILTKHESVWCQLHIQMNRGDYLLNGCPWDKSLRQRPSKEDAR